MEKIWDYPRPPTLEQVAKPIRIEFAGCTIAATEAVFRVLETSHPPVYYLPRTAFTGCRLEPAPGRSFCEWKGEANYWRPRVTHLAYVDCTNLFIEGQRVSAVAKGMAHNWPRGAGKPFCWHRSPSPSGHRRS